MRIVMHIDMDAFFAACEERYNPRFRGLPIVVGADPKGGAGRGVVSTASYAARKFGIRSAMPISQAWRMAEAARKKGEPETIFLNGNHALYREVSERIMAILKNAGGIFEQASIDEAYIELKAEGLRTKARDNPWDAAEEFASALKAEILKAEGLTCSIGIGPSKLIAKIASDFQKPDGLTVVRPDEVQKFLDPMPTRAIPGIGPKTGAALHNRGILTIGDLRHIDCAELVAAFGKWGEDLFSKSRGLDDSPVSNEWEPKSIGEQETFERDTLQAAFILERAQELAASVFKRLDQEGFNSWRTTVITVRFADFTTMTRSRTAPKPLKTQEMLNGEYLRLLLPFLDARENPRKKKIRLIGVRVEKLS